MQTENSHCSVQNASNLKGWVHSKLLVFSLMNVLFLQNNASNYNHFYYAQYWGDMFHAEFIFCSQGLFQYWSWIPDERDEKLSFAWGKLNFHCNNFLVHYYLHDPKNVFGFELLEEGSDCPQCLMKIIPRKVFFFCSWPFYMCDRLPGIWMKVGLEGALFW